MEKNNLSLQIKGVELEEVFLIENFFFFLSEKSLPRNNLSLQMYF